MKILYAFFAIAVSLVSGQLLPRGSTLGFTVGRSQTGGAPAILSTNTSPGIRGRNLDKFPCGHPIATNGSLFVSLALPQLTTTISLNNVSFDDVVENHDPCVHDPEMHMTAPQIIRKRGYPAQTHTVITEDGYILEMHRIPKPGAPPILVQHGIFLSSAAWVLAGPDKGLAYILSDAGFDVWLGNYRGNTYSRKHLDMRADDPKFWDFSFHEMGLFDLPAEIDYILKVTRNFQLDYIGFSMGNTGFFIMASMRPEYNFKIRQMHAMAPVVFLEGCTSPIKSICPIVANYQNMELLPLSDFLRSYARTYCRNGGRSQLLCSNLILLIAGWDPKQFNETMLPVIASHAPAGAPIKAMTHYCQLKKSARFRPFDYGRAKNFAVYGTRYPPDYDLSKVICPVYLHYGLNDLIGSPSGARRLSRKLGNCRGAFKVPYSRFNHMDFVFAIDVKSLVYDRIIDLLKS